MIELDLLEKMVKADEAAWYAFITDAPDVIDLADSRNYWFHASKYKPIIDNIRHYMQSLELKLETISEQRTIH